MTFAEMLLYQPDECKNCLSCYCNTCDVGRPTFEKIGEDNYIFTGMCHGDPQELFNSRKLRGIDLYDGL